MARGKAGSDDTPWLAVVAGVAMIVHQVAGKATRDALFLSVFGVKSLPWMMIVSSLLTIIVILGASIVMRRRGPTDLVWRACLVSAALHLVERALLTSRTQNLAAIALYLHIAIAPVLVSGFWSLLSEGPDPRASRREMARAALACCVGGVLGGALAWFRDVAVMLPLLAGIQVLGAAATYALRSRSADLGAVEAEVRSADATPSPGGVRQALRMAPYLRHLAMAVLLCAASAALLDVVFKMRVEAAYPTRMEMMRVFSIFYMSTGLLALIVQFSLSRLALSTVGLAPTAAALPLGVGLGSAAALAMPGLMTATIARGSEAVLRNSLFRSAYEPLFSALPAGQKNASKTAVDVGFERVGDLLGAGLARAFLTMGAVAAIRWQLVSAMVLATIGLMFARLIHRGYQDALRDNLRNGAVAPDPMLLYNSTSMPIVRQFLEEQRADESSARDSVIGQIAALSSGDAATIRPVLEGATSLRPRLVAHVIPLLGRDDEIARYAVAALRRVAAENAGQLVDRLLDTDVDLAVRRRIPRVLAVSHSRRAVEGLLAGLDDPRFEIRHECGRALARMRGRDPRFHADRRQMVSCVLREVETSQDVWEARRLMVAPEDLADATFIDERLRLRANRSLEHVFNLLSLVLAEGDALIIAFHALHTDDRGLRGTALDYLEAVLPRPIREKLWPFLEPGPLTPRERRSQGAALAALLDSRDSVETSLTTLHRRLSAERGTPPA